MIAPKSPTTQMEIIGQFGPPGGGGRSLLPSDDSLVVIVAGFVGAEPVRMGNSVEGCTGIRGVNGDVGFGPLIVCVDEDGGGFSWLLVLVGWSELVAVVVVARVAACIASDKSL